MSFHSAVHSSQSGAPPLSVMIVEDLPAYRDDLVRALAPEHGFEVIQVCTDLPPALAAIQERCPDVLLVDLGLPRGSGFELIQLAARRWQGRCVPAVLTMTCDIELMLDAFRVGAKGFLIKGDQPQQWRDAVRILGSGGSPTVPAVAKAVLEFLIESGRLPHGHISSVLKHLAAAYDPQELARKLGLSTLDVWRSVRIAYHCLEQQPPSLSDRQLEVLKLLDKGLSHKECADVLGIGVTCVKTHVKRSYEKLGVNNAQMALYEARQAGLLA